MAQFKKEGVYKVKVSPNRESDLIFKEETKGTWKFVSPTTGSTVVVPKDQAKRYGLESYADSSAKSEPDIKATKATSAPKGAAKTSVTFDDSKLLAPPKIRSSADAPAADDKAVAAAKEHIESMKRQGRPDMTRSEIMTIVKGVSPSANNNPAIVADVMRQLENDGVMKRSNPNERIERATQFTIIRDPKDARPKDTPEPGQPRDAIETPATPVDEADAPSNQSTPRQRRGPQERRVRNSKNKSAPRTLFSRDGKVSSPEEIAKSEANTKRATAQELREASGSNVRSPGEARETAQAPGSRRATPEDVAKFPAFSQAGILAKPPERKSPDLANRWAEVKSRIDAGEDLTLDEAMKYIRGGSEAEADTKVGKGTIDDTGAVGDAPAASGGSGGGDTPTTPPAATGGSGGSGKATLDDGKAEFVKLAQELGLSPEAAESMWDESVAKNAAKRAAADGNAGKSLEDLLGVGGNTAETPAPAAPTQPQAPAGRQPFDTPDFPRTGDDSGRPAPRSGDNMFTHSPLGGSAAPEQGLKDALTTIAKERGIRHPAAAALFVAGGLAAAMTAGGALDSAVSGGGQPTPRSMPPQDGRPKPPVPLWEAEPQSQPQAPQKPPGLISGLMGDRPTGMPQGSPQAPQGQPAPQPAPQPQGGGQGNYPMPQANPRQEQSNGSQPVGNVQTKGGDYPIYRKDSAPAQSFRDAFVKALREDQPVFEWQGRMYRANLADG